jgi:uncharacterized protein YjbI with pentapeptide repeats
MLHNSPIREESRVIQLPHHRRRPASIKVLLWVVSIVALLAFAITVLCSYLLGWRGTGFPGQTAWDWLDLLLVPIVLVIGGYLLTQRQSSLDREIAADQSHADRDIADQHRQDASLLAYLDHIGKLLLDTEKPLRTSKEGDDVRSLARAWTLTILRRLDSGRKGSVLQFLYVSGLVSTGRSVVSLEGSDLIAASLIQVDLRGANLSLSKLADAVLREADLRRANLYGTDLSGADLRMTNLYGANLYGADLSGADLRGANLRGANLRGANLRGADLSRTLLSEADLSNAFMGGADLSGAKLADAVLRGTDLRRAKVKLADLKEADLSGAKLADADLRWSDMTATLGLTEEQFRTTLSLYGSIMPDGRALRGDERTNRPTFDDWLNELEDRGLRGE